MFIVQSMFLLLSPFYSPSFSFRPLFAVYVLFWSFRFCHPSSFFLLLLVSSSLSHTVFVIFGLCSISSVVIYAYMLLFLYAPLSALFPIFDMRYICRYVANEHLLKTHSAGHHDSPYVAFASIHCLYGLHFFVVFRCFFFSFCSISTPKLPFLSLFCCARLLLPTLQVSLGRSTIIFVSFRYYGIVATF